MLRRPTASSFTFLCARNLARLQKSVFPFNNICLFILTNTTDWEGSFHFMNSNIVLKLANIPPSGSAKGQAGQERWFMVVGLFMSFPMLRKPCAHATVPAAGASYAQAKWGHLKAPHCRKGAPGHGQAASLGSKSSGIHQAPQHIRVTLCHAPIFFGNSHAL